jgi:hypothetical protein
MIYSTAYKKKKKKPIKLLNPNKKKRLKYTISTETMDLGLQIINAKFMIHEYRAGRVD